jgi:PhnB protein
MLKAKLVCTAQLYCATSMCAKIRRTGMITKDKEKAPVAVFLVVPKLDAAVRFYSKAFGAKEDERYQDPRGKVWYAVLRILGVPLQLMEPFKDMGLVAARRRRISGDSAMLAISVRNVDDMFNNAIKSGGTAIVEPQHDAFRGDRYAECRDPFGHRWSIRTAKDKAQIEPIIVVKKLDDAIKFYNGVFGAKEDERYLDPRVKVSHAAVRVLGATVHLMEPSRELGFVSATRRPTSGDSAMVTVSVKDVDDTFKKAIRAGATPIIDPQDAYWGDRYAEFRDPFGVRYSCCSETPLGGEEINPAELQVQFQSFLVEHGNPTSPAPVVGVRNV